MATFDTTATCQEDVYIVQDQANTNQNGNAQLTVSGSNAGSKESALISFVLPSKPTGIDRIDRLKLVLTDRFTTGSPGSRVHRVNKISQKWTEGSATWNNYAGGAAWGTGGGDPEGDLTFLAISGTYGSSFAYDITALGMDWGGRGSVLVRDSNDPASEVAYIFFDKTNATVAFRPHIVIVAVDDPPALITDLSVSPDLSLSESSFTYRQRAILAWSKSSENDFKRYRLRYGINRSLAANHTHRAFVNSRASTTYLDSTLYTDGSTIYYYVYPEDTRNASTSTFLGATYTSVSNIISWTKPAALIGRVNPSSSASVLDSVEVNVRQTNDSAGIGSAMGSFKRAKIVWADKSYSVTGNLTSAGGYAYARHRYTAASATLTVRALVEDIKGFRSGLDSYATAVAINSPGPVAKIVASPTRTFTASTFSFGLDTLTTSTFHDMPSYLLFRAQDKSPTDGVGISFKWTRASTGTFVGVLLRNEAAGYRVVYADAFVISAASAAGAITRRDINWRMKRNDIVGMFLP